MYPYLDIFGMSIPSYGLCMAVGILLSFYICFVRARKNKLDIDSLIVIAACAVGLGLVGAKLLYLFVSCDINEVFERLSRGDISDLVGGGQVFYGGLIMGIIGAFLGVRISGSYGETALYCDAVVPAIPLGHAFGRIGCFLAGCCYGAPYTGFCAVTFPSVGVTEPVFPIQLLEAVLNLIIFAILLIPRKRLKSGFATLYLYLTLYSVVRFTLEFFRGDEIRGFAQGLSTSQWISIGLFVCGFVLILITAKQKKLASQAV